MTDKYILNKEHLVPFLRKLTKNYRLIAPVRTQQGDTLLQPVSTVDGVPFDFSTQAQGSAKPFFFPQQETLFTYRTKDQVEYSFTPIRDDEQTIFFGIRSCDLSAILYMDVIFLKNTKDPYYLQRRENSVLVTIGCHKPFPNCFCNATKNGPFLDFGYDLQLTDLGDRYFVESGRIKGDALLRRWPQFFTEASEEDRRAQYQVSLEARGEFQQQVHVDTAIKKLAISEPSEDVWLTLSGRCQDCGGCAYICPTCTCFSLTDLAFSNTEGKRVRSWDACTFDGFTRMAGGHNPVHRQHHAVRRRFLHKLLYDYAEHGRPSCVGCGRCVGMCFGGVDIIQFLNMVSEGLSSPKKPHSCEHSQKTSPSEAMTNL